MRNSLCIYSYFYVSKVCKVWKVCKVFGGWNGEEEREGGEGKRRGNGYVYMHVLYIPSVCVYVYVCRKGQDWVYLCLDTRVCFLVPQGFLLLTTYCTHKNEGQG